LSQKVDDCEPLAYGAAATATTTVTVAPPTTNASKRRSLLQLQLQSPRALPDIPDYSRTLPEFPESGRSLLESSPGRSRSLLQSVVPVTDYAELSAAQVIIRELLEPAMAIGASTQAVQAAGIYSAKFGKSPAGAILAGCAEPGAIAAEHVKVAEALLKVRALLPKNTQTPKMDPKTLPTHPTRTPELTQLTQHVPRGSRESPKLPELRARRV
jgi:hypothetical protein